MSITKQQFFARYANTPLDKRDLPIPIGKDGDTSEEITLNMMYSTIKYHLKAIADSEEQIEYALGISEKFLNTHTLTRITLD